MKKINIIVLHHIKDGKQKPLIDQERLSKVKSKIASIYRRK